MNDNETTMEDVNPASSDAMPVGDAPRAGSTIPPMPPMGLQVFPRNFQFCEVHRSTRRVLTFRVQPSAPADTDDTFFVMLDPPFDHGANLPTSTTQELRYTENAGLRWEETLPFDQLLSAAIDQTYADIDSIYLRAVGARTVEYQEAEAAARAYLAADVKPSPASIFITSHALSNPTKQVQSEEWACQRIIERADAFKWAVSNMRDARAHHQGQMRAAETIDTLETAKGNWRDYIVWMCGVLGI